MLSAPEQDTRYRALHRAVLRLAAAAPAGPETIGALLKDIAASAAEALGARDARIVLEEHPAWRDLVSGKGPADGQVVLGIRGVLERWPILNSFPAAHVLASGEPLYVPDMAQEARFNPLSTRWRRGIRSFAVVPLRSGGRILGSLAVDFAHAGELPLADREVLDLFAAHAAAALDRAQLIHEALERARQDEAARQARAAEQAAVLARSESLAIAAHELRTPLTTMRGYVQLVLRRVHQLKEQAGPAAALDRIQESLETADHQARKLTRLMTQLLDVSRMEAGRMRLDRERTDLAALAAATVESARLLDSGAGLTLRIPTQPVWAHVDPLRLEQVLANLIDNAIKYSPPEGEVVVELSRGAGGPKALRLVVQDRGPGVPPERRQLLFQRFYRADGPAQRTGAGLGLFICRQIVELHGGHIKASFPAQGGTRMVVTFPDFVLLDD